MIIIMGHWMRDARYSRYMEECKYGTNCVKSGLSRSSTKSIDFDYDEAKAKEAKKRKREPDKFAEHSIFQRRGKGLPRWFHSDDKKASEIMNKYAII